MSDEDSRHTAALNYKRRNIKFTLTKLQIRERRDSESDDGSVQNVNVWSRLRNGLNGSCKITASWRWNTTTSRTRSEICQFHHTHGATPPGMRSCCTMRLPFAYLVGCLLREDFLLKYVVQCMNGTQLQPLLLVENFSFAHARPCRAER